MDHGCYFTLAMSLVLTTSALAFDCTNVSKSDPAAGTQVMIDLTTGEVTALTEGLARRIEQGLVDPVTGRGSRPGWARFRR